MSVFLLAASEKCTETVSFCFFVERENRGEFLSGLVDGLMCPGQARPGTRCPRVQGMLKT